MSSLILGPTKPAVRLFGPNYLNSDEVLTYGGDGHLLSPLRRCGLMRLSY